MPLSRSTPTVAEIDRAVSFVHRARLAGSRRTRLVTLLFSPAHVWATLCVLARLPVVEVSTPTRCARPVEFYSPFTGSRPTRAMQRLRSALRLPCLRVGQAVLRLPATFEDYRRGRPRQAVRTNCRRALELGLEVREVPGEDAGIRVFGEVLFGSAQACEEFLATADRSRLPTKGLRTLAVYDAAGRVLGAAAFYRSGPYARLEAIKCVSSELSSVARYLLHTRMVEVLVAEGAELLFADSAITVTPGLHYLQQRIGYEMTNVRIRTTPGSRRLEAAPAVRLVPPLVRPLVPRERGSAPRHRRTA